MNEVMTTYTVFSGYRDFSEDSCYLNYFIQHDDLEHSL